MTTPAPTTETTDESAAPAAVVTPAAAPRPAPPKTATFTQEQVNILINERIERERATIATKEAARATDLQALTDQVSQLTAQNTKTESAAVAAILAKAAAGTHNPAQVAALVDLAGLTSADGPAIEAKVAEFLAANPYFVNAATATVVAPNLTPAPGVGNAGSNDKTLLTEAELDAITPEEMAADPAKLALYSDSRRALRGAPAA